MKSLISTSRHDGSPLSCSRNGLPRRKLESEASRHLVEKKRLKACLSKVLVGGQGLDDCTTLHHRETDAIRQAPFLVSTIAVESSGLDQQFVGNGHDLVSRF